MNDPYAILGVARTASADEIKTAFRALAKKHHPDLNPNDPAAEARFKEVSAAYEAIQNPQPNPHTGRHYDPFGFSFRAGDFNFDDLFRAQFEDALRRQREAPKRNPDISAFCTITLEQAFQGCEVDIGIARVNANTYRVKIPAGVEEGMRMRVPGVINAPDQNAAPGDLYVVVRVLGHEKFMRSGDHLVTNLEIDSLLAIVGTKLTVSTIEGSSVEVEVPPGTQYGDQQCVSGHGMRVLNGEGRGNLYVNFSLRTPTTLTAAHREVVETLKDLLP